ncbi:MAG: hypothetical protein NVS1B13_03640 [Flavisolibacter sp.]
MIDYKVLESVDRYLAGEMTIQEQQQFELLRSSNSEIDQLVVEHTLFLGRMRQYGQRRKFKNTLHETHQRLVQKGLISNGKLQGRHKIAYLYNRYKKLAAVAASIAGITALTISALVWSLSPNKPRREDIFVTNLSRDIRSINQKVNQIQQKNQELAQSINAVKEKNGVIGPISYKSGGTGFLLDPKGYLLTNAHVIENATHIAVQGSNGSDLKATVLYVDNERDLAILKIEDKGFKVSKALPYGIKKSGAEIAEPIYTLGYPRNDIVYGEGYLAAKTGYNGDTLTCQITVPANRGNSGSPILNKNGDVVGILSTKQNTAEGAVFAIRSKYIYTLLNNLIKEDSSFREIKLPSASLLKGADRMLQVKRISDFVYLVKVD